MQLRTSLFCLGIMALNVGCGDKGSGDGDEGNGGSSSSTAGKGGGGSNSSAGSGTDTSGKSGGGTDSGESGSPATGEAGSATGPSVTKAYTFDTDVEEFVVSDSSAAVGVEPVMKAAVVLAHNEAEGEPDPGSLQMDIPYGAASQYVSTGVDARPVGMRAETDKGPDLSGKTLTAWVRIESGYGDAAELATAPGNAKIYAKTGPTYVYGSAAVANLTEVGVWMQLTFKVSLPDYNADEETYDPTDVREIGIQFDTNSASTTAAPAVVLIDTISY